MDFAEVWGPVSILLAGGFGILALVTEYKDPATKRINRWGKIALWGILITTTCGLIAQIQSESKGAAASKKAEDRQDRIEELTKIINDKVSKSDKSSAVRLELPLSGARINVSYEISCEWELYRKICSAVDESEDGTTDFDLKEPRSNSFAIVSILHADRKDHNVDAILFGTLDSISSRVRSFGGQDTDADGHWHLTVDDRYSLTVEYSSGIQFIPDVSQKIIEITSCSPKQGVPPPIVGEIEILSRNGIPVFSGEPYRSLPETIQDDFGDFKKTGCIIYQYKVENILNIE